MIGSNNGCSMCLPLIKPPEGKPHSKTEPSAARTQRDWNRRGKAVYKQLHIAPSS